MKYETANECGFQSHDDSRLITPWHVLNFLTLIRNLLLSRKPGYLILLLSLQLLYIHQVADLCWDHGSIENVVNI
jgi:hypothetical protein